MEDYSSIEKKKLLMNAISLVNLTGIILSKISQAQNSTYLFVWKYRKKLIWSRETEAEQWWPGAGSSEADCDEAPAHLLGVCGNVLYLDYSLIFVLQVYTFIKTHKTIMYFCLSAYFFTVYKLYLKKLIMKMVLWVID